MLTIFPTALLLSTPKPNRGCFDAVLICFGVAPVFNCYISGISICFMRVQV
jgi:hypothetical protein